MTPTTGLLPPCTCCAAPAYGTPSDASAPVRLDARCALPDAVADLPEDRRGAVWGADPLLQVENAGSFLRCLLPIRLGGGSELVYGVWLGVDADTFARVVQMWNTPAAYPQLVVDGYLANAVPPWGADVLGLAARVAVRDAGEFPYVVAGAGLLGAIGAGVHGRDRVLGALSWQLPVPVRQSVGLGWSLERSAGMSVAAQGDGLLFSGPGRTVLAEAWQSSVPREPAAYLEHIVGDGRPDGLIGEQRSDSPDEIRLTVWSTTTEGGRQRYAVDGFVFRRESFLQILCRHDDPADHPWARAVVESAAFAPPAA